MLTSPGDGQRSLPEQQWGLLGFYNLSIIKLDGAQKQGCSSANVGVPLQPAACVAVGFGLCDQLRPVDSEGRDV